MGILDEFLLDIFKGEGMSKRNKIILSLAITAFVVLSLVVGLVVVFAEENSIVRNLNASYRVYNADCHVSASYAYGNAKTKIYSETNSFTVSGLEDGDKFLTFDKTTATQNTFQEKMLKPTNDIVLTKENNTIIFKFNVVNFDSDALKVTINLDGELNQNLNIQYSKDGKIWTNDNKRINLSGTEGYGSNEINYFVKISLIDDGQDFNFNQDIAVTIHN